MQDAFGCSRSTVAKIRKRIDAGAEVTAAQRQPDPATASAAAAFLDRIKGKYAQALLYGSRARGDHQADSDADIAVILKGPKRRSRAAAVIELSDAANEAMLETGIVIQAMPIWESELRRPETFSNPALLADIKRDGIRL